MHFLTSLLQTTTKSLADETKKDKIIEKDVTMLANLKWSDTDNFYMNLGCHKGVGLVVCGDDKVRLKNILNIFDIHDNRDLCGCTTVPAWCRLSRNLSGRSWSPAPD